MGELVNVLYGVLAVIGIALIGIGALRQHRALVVLGSALLLAGTGAWMFGLLGGALGVLALVFWKTAKPEKASAAD
ncbi:MAG: hypothetical protein ACREMA_09600, partial [Longimicrobiales bacterium]